MLKSQKRKNKLPQKGGLVLGWSKNMKKLYCNTSDTHSLIIGATGSGKSRHLVLQSVGLTAMAGESMILVDPKSELYLYTRPFLERLGYEIITIDFKHPEKSNRYNFLQPVLDAVLMNDLALAASCARDIATLLVPDRPNSNTDPVWTNGERAIVTVAILAVCLEFEDPKWQNIDNARHFLATMCTPSGPKDDIPLIPYLERLPQDSGLRRAMAIARIAPEKMRGSFYSSSLTTLDIFGDKPIHAMTAATDFDHLATGDRKRAIFIILPDEKSTYYPVASLFVFQQYQLLVRRADQNGGRLPRRVEFFCDEFGNFVKIPDMDKAITVGRGRGIRFHLFVQDTTQIYEKYGDKLGRTMTANCDTWVYLYTKNTDTMEEVGKLLGKYTVKSPSLSASTGGQASASYNLTGRELLTMEEIKSIDRPWQLVLGRGAPAMMYAPDISKTFFNGLFGMGDMEHDQKLQIYRDTGRPIRTASVSYWDGYQKYI